jgi:hypothetical protein
VAIVQKPLANVITRDRSCATGAVKLTARRLALLLLIVMLGMLISCAHIIEKSHFKLSNDTLKTNTPVEVTTSTTLL